MKQMSINDISPELPDLLTTNITNGISILACIWFFFRCASLPKRTLGVQMIIILAIGNFLFHLTTIFDYWFTELKIMKITRMILDVSTKFSLLWAANISYFLYLLVNMNEVSKLKVYWKVSLVTFFILCFGFAIE